MKNLAFFLITLLLISTGVSAAQNTGREQITPENIDRLTELASIGRASIQDVIWTPDGEQIIVITAIGFYVYDGRDLTLEPTFHEQSFPDRLFFLVSPDGQYLLGYVDTFGSNTEEVRRDVWVWRVHTGKLAFSTDVLLDSEMPLDIVKVLFFPNSGRALLISVHGGFYEWNLETPSQIKTIAPDQTDWDIRFGEYAFSTDGRWLAREGNGVQVWNTETWELVTHIEGYPFGTGRQPLNFNRDSTQLLATSSSSGDRLEQNIVRLIDLANGEIVSEWEMDITVATFDPNGVPIAAESSADPNGGIRMINLQTDEILWEYMDEGFTSGAFNSNGSLFMSFIGDSAGANLRIWNTASGEAILNQRFAHFIRQAISPDSTRLVISSGFEIDFQNWRSMDSRLQLWDMQTGALLSENLDHSHSTTETIFSPDSQFMAIGGKDEMRLWDMKTWEVRDLEKTDLIDPRKYYYPLEFSLDGQILLGHVESTNGSVYPVAWDVQTGNLIDTSLPSRHLNQLDPSGELVASATTDSNTDRSTITIYTFPDQEEILSIALEVEQVRFSTDSTLINAFTRDGWIGVWEVETGHRIFWDHTHQEAELYIGNNVYIDPSNRWLVNRAGSTEIWNLETGDYWGEAYKIEFSSNGDLFVAIDPEHFTIEFYNTATGTPLEIMSSIVNVSDMALSPDSRILAIQTQDELQARNHSVRPQISFYDLQNQTWLADLDNQVSRFNPQFSPDGTLLAAQAQGERIIIYGID